MSNLSWSMENKPTCEICEQYLGVQWTDTHGVVACLNCGAPYRIYRSGDNQNRIASGCPALALKPEHVPVLRRYVVETSRKFPSGFNFPGSDYEFVSDEDVEAFSKWMTTHADNMLSEAMS